MKPISKLITYGFSKSVQLFIKDENNYVLIVCQRGIDGDMQKKAQYYYKDYLKAVDHMHKIVINFVFPDLFQK